MEQWAFDFKKIITIRGVKLAACVYIRKLYGYCKNTQ